MTRALALCALLLTACAGTVPTDVMTRLASMIQAGQYAYDAVCHGRELAPECVDMRRTVNAVVDSYNSINDELSE